MSEWWKRSAYLLVKTRPGAAQNVWKKSQTWPETIGSWMVTGPWDVLIWVDAHSWDEVYAKAVALKNSNWVDQTSSHFVYQGGKNGHWWWQKPAGSWVFLRGAKLNGNYQKLARWNWVTSWTSIPGEWDGLAWVSGKNWQEVWKHVWDLNQSGWQTETLVPVKSWWNKSWSKSWWA